MDRLIDEDMCWVERGCWGVGVVPGEYEVWRCVVDEVRNNEVVHHVSFI